MKKVIILDVKELAININLLCEGYSKKDKKYLMKLFYAAISRARIK